MVQDFNHRSLSEKQIKLIHKSHKVALCLLITYTFNNISNLQPVEITAPEPVMFFFLNNWFALGFLGLNLTCSVSICTSAFMQISQYCQSFLQFQIIPCTTVMMHYFQRSPMILRLKEDPPNYIIFSLSLPSSVPAPCVPPSFLLSSYKVPQVKVTIMIIQEVISGGRKKMLGTAECNEVKLFCISD